jgi:hypothetical protein
MGLNKRKTRRRKMQGGIGETHGFPPCNNLSQFKITDEQILGFKRISPTPMDCFINALQILGVIDNITANIMRISSAGKTGFTSEEIEKIFIYLSGHNHDFKSTGSPQEFSEWIAKNLLPGYVVFAGHEGGNNHVYLIGRELGGKLLYIDPQVGILCDLSTEECQGYLINNRVYRLLFNSVEKLSPGQLTQLGFIL